jgi:hypothetical protein
MDLVDTVDIVDVVDRPEVGSEERLRGRQEETGVGRGRRERGQIGRVVRAVMARTLAMAASHA